MIPLYDYQMDSVKQMHNGCILCGGVGSGKSRTSLAYYYIQQGGNVESKNYVPMKNPMDLYIITTARKRDTFEWEKELVPFQIGTPRYKSKVMIDSWNNIKKYKEVENAFFIFDEQRLVGSGEWVKAFYKIAANNQWILLSATPGDTWLDYIPVFVANGFFKNKTEFIREHVVYSNYSKFPRVERYLNTGRLIRLRKSLLIDMDYHKPHELIDYDIFVDYDKDLYKQLLKTRWNFEKEEPIMNASELCYMMRKIVNSDISRINALKDIINQKVKVIVFYNFDYELELIKKFDYFVEFKDEDENTYLEKTEIAEWNGHKHEPIPDSKSWLYLVQYNAGAEGWNCVNTDTIVFYSQNYSYKIMVQSSGRIDRLNSPYHKLYYYHLKSKSSIDLAIAKAISNKKKFNETKFVNK